MVRRAWADHQTFQHVATTGDGASA